MAWYCEGGTLSSLEAAAGLHRADPVLRARVGWCTGLACSYRDIGALKAVCFWLEVLSVAT